MCAITLSSAFNGPSKLFIARYVFSIVHAWPSKLIKIALTSYSNVAT